MSDASFKWMLYGIALCGVALGVLVTVGVMSIPSRAVVAPPSDVVCAVFDMSTATGKQWKGWHPLSEEARQRVSRLVGAGLAEIIPADSLDCIERHPGNPRIGQVVEVKRIEWWRWKEKKRAATLSQH